MVMMSSSPSNNNHNSINDFVNEIDTKLETTQLRS